MAFRDVALAEEGGVGVVQGQTHQAAVTAVVSARAGIIVVEGIDLAGVGVANHAAAVHEVAPVLHDEGVLHGLPAFQIGIAEHTAHEAVHEVQLAVLRQQVGDVKGVVPIVGIAVAVPPQLTGFHIHLIEQGNKALDIALLRAGSSGWPVADEGRVQSAGAFVIGKVDGHQVEIPGSNTIQAVEEGHVLVMQLQLLSRNKQQELYR